ncbi:cytochrome oxidase maturation protein, cbb3-type [Arcobacter nitrofigilis DSM 7299]|uniref:Cytochrome oxidase maturation protein, cbb3-type n=1 Tax=Arcobacter nitrofigilis (strain ATCC 33309 / DSM 7299 / CCUG 15893 / LMG 7604 / NCTC 12251 / CI) TaxID=572480 RepID=D5V2L8_ARCNC|nr:cbb3-type cytochrome oxidase assembly protein CcoS [Arcobacter nitrofigilis]ADG92450.1 cytochrome oxidase maturation protein, cbb3-type [Arcobacter nitrofigilis DSM 7299]
MIGSTLLMMLVVGLIVSFAILGMFIWGAKTGQFDDTNKMMDGLLFDSQEDLNDAISRENKKEQENEEQKKSKPKN